MHINFGTVCMSYALQQTLLKYNVKGELAKYAPITLGEGAIEQWLKKHQRNRLCAHLIWLLSEYHAAGINADKRFRFIRFENKHITFSPICYTKEDVDKLLDNNDYSAVVVESDCVWHPYYLDDMFSLKMSDKDIYRFSYAPSFFVSELSHQHEAHVQSYYKEFQQINRISVREKSGADLLKRLVGVDAAVVVDPVMLLTRDEWTKIMKSKSVFKKGKYIFAYVLENNIAARRRIVNIAHLMKVPYVVWLTVGNINYTDDSYPDVENIDLDGKADPSDFLRLIEDSVCVATDSFHALNFSIIFQKTFFAFERQNLYWQPDDRINNLLETYDLKNQIVGLEERITEETIQKRMIIDYQTVSSKLNENRNRSLEFIKQCIDEMLSSNN